VQVRHSKVLSTEAASGLRDEEATCPLRARSVSGTRGFMVTGGAPGMRCDLRRHWSSLPAALIPKLIVRPDLHHRATSADLLVPPDRASLRAITRWLGVEVVRSSHTPVVTSRGRGS
jgi:hypothetical protein